MLFLELVLLQVLRAAPSHNGSMRSLRSSKLAACIPCMPSSRLCQPLGLRLSWHHLPSSFRRRNKYFRDQRVHLRSHQRVMRNIHCVWMLKPESADNRIWMSGQMWTQATHKLSQSLSLSLSPFYILAGHGQHICKRHDRIAPRDVRPWGRSGHLSDLIASSSQNIPQP